MASLFNLISTALSLFGAGDDGCEFSLSCGGSTVTFPVAPSSFDVTTKYNNDVVRVNNYGDVTMLGTKGVKTIAFSSFFPAVDYEWVSISGDPWTLVKQIESFATITPRQPCRLSISGTGINTAVAINDFTYSMKDSSGDIYFSITLAEYTYLLSKSGTLNDITGLNSRVAEVKKEVTTKVNQGDHLMDVANRVTHGLKVAEQGARRIALYKELVKANAVTGTILVVKDGEKWVKQ